MKKGIRATDVKEDEELLARISVGVDDIDEPTAEAVARAILRMADRSRAAGDYRRLFELADMCTLTLNPRHHGAGVSLLELGLYLGDLGDYTKFSHPEDDYLRGRRRSIEADLSAPR